MQFLILGITIFILAVNVLVGMRRGFRRGLLRFVTLLLALLGAFLMAKPIAGSVAEQIEPVLAELLASNPDAAGFLAANPTVADSAIVLARMLVTPLIFLLCYVVLKVVTWVLYLILRIVFRVKKGKILPLRWVGGGLMGLAAGLIGVLVFVTPVLGYTTLVSRTVEEAQSFAGVASSLSLDTYNEQYIKPASQAPVAKQLYSGIGSKMFDGLTTVEWDGKDAKLETEWFAVIGVVDHAASLGKRPVAEYGAAESTAVHGMAAGVGESRLLSGIGGGAVNGIANSWLGGKDFMGVAKPVTGDESVDVVLSGFLKVLATTTPEIIGEDLEMFADLFDLFIKYELFTKIDANGSTDALVTHLATSGFLEEARAMLTANPRLEPVTTAISDVGMRMLVRHLGDPAKYLEEHGALMDSMSNVLKNSVNEDGSMNMTAMTENLNTVFAENGVSVPDSATDIIAQGLADEFTSEELTNLTVEEITDRMITRFSNTENISQYMNAIPAA